MTRLSHGIVIRMKVKVTSFLGVSVSIQYVLFVAFDTSLMIFCGMKVGEAPTIVIGIGLVHGMHKSVVSASVCLNGGMRLSLSCFIQQKSDTVSDLVMKDIIKVRISSDRIYSCALRSCVTISSALKVSMDHYINENNCNPERILLFRDGISDGNFDIAHAEIKRIQEASEERIGCKIPLSE
jgi:hypothetical protein